MKQRQSHPHENGLAQLTVTPYERRYRHDVRDLMFHNYRTHSHLDWYETDQWLDAGPVPMRLAWAGRRLGGFMAASLPLNNTAWIRMAALTDDIQAQPVLSALWDELSEELRELGVRTVALLILRDWIAHYAPQLGFHHVENIVTMRRTARPLVEIPTPPFSIRTVTAEDLDIITVIDQAAFQAPWQLTGAELRQASRVAAVCTVAEQGDMLLGYQLSTLYFDGGHLARLAVHPSAQNRGVGAALLHDLIQRFARRGVGSITVNTQASNERSQRLYRRFGFERNGYDLPVWMMAL